MKYLKNKLIFIPYRLPFDWPCDFINQSVNILSLDNVVIMFLWADSNSIFEIVKSGFNHRLLSIDNNKIIYRPIHFLPFRRFSFIQYINFVINLCACKLITLLRGYRYREKLIWLFEPYFQKWLRFFNDYKIIYDCVDFFSSNKNEREVIRSREIALLKVSYMNFANSKVLYKYLSNYSENVKLVPQGFRFDSYMKANIVLPRKISDRIRIGYIGGINYRINFSLLNYIVKKRPNYEFYFAGIVQLGDDKIVNNNILKNIDKLKTFKNVTFASVNIDDLPFIVSTFSVGIIPYTSTMFNKKCFPMKLLEYFYCGLPVVSTYIEELANEYGKYVNISMSKSDFIEKIDSSISMWPDCKQFMQREISLQHSWKNKLESIDNYLFENSTANASTFN